MRSLRRDLLERKLWPVIALLLAAVIAVPLVLLKGAPANGTPTPLPPTAAATTTTTTSTSQSATSTVPASSRTSAKKLAARLPRDPFASGMPKLSSKPASASSSPSDSSSSSSSSTSTVAMVSPSPATTSTTTTTAATTPTTPSTSATSTTTTATTTSTTSSTPAATPATAQTSPQSWTTYGVSVRYGKNAGAPVQSDLARLTLLPSARTPALMFLGVMAGGHQAVFALGSGVTHKGPGLCRPDHDRCSAIVLKAGQTEQLTVPTVDGGHQAMILRVVHITGTVTHSRAVALAAYERHSAAGLCDLELADPVSYSQTKGTISTAAAADCQGQPAPIPFPYPVTGP
jgi:hypothetical protein